MGQIYNSKTFRLFKEEGIESSVVGSVSSIFDFPSSHELYNYDVNEKNADQNSLRDDWIQVGKDLESSIEEHATPTTA